jgi:hypothetical protein
VGGYAAADPVVTLFRPTDTDVHIRWYAPAPVDGQPLPAHQDADIILKGVLLSSFVLGQDYHLI